MPRKKSKNTAQVALRVTPDCIRRSSALIPYCTVPGMRVDRADVMRVALLRGLDVLEAEAERGTRKAAR